jgi:hypothetical protein
MEQGPLIILALTLIFLVTCNATEARNAGQVSLIDVDHGLVDSLKDIFSGHAPEPKEKHVSGKEAPAGYDMLGNGQTRLGSFHGSSNRECNPVFPPMWPPMAKFTCCCQSWCEYYLVCCVGRTRLIQIKLELALIERSFEAVPNTTHIEVIVQQEDGKPVKIQGEASLEMSNNTISRQLVHDLGREDEIQHDDSRFATKGEYLVMTVLLGSDYQPFANQTFFVLEPGQNYANSNIVIGSNVLNAMGI